LLGLSALETHEHVKLILELDSSIVAKALQANFQDRSRCWTIYEEAKRLMAEVDDVSIRLSGRETNRVADSRAKLACSLGERDTRDELPVSIRDLVSIDSNHCNHV
jgi:ribonuclease HI